MSEQLELFDDTPFSVRLKIDEAMAIFWDTYWKNLPTSKSTVAHRRRIQEYFKGRFIDTINKVDVAEFRRMLIGNGLSPSTANQAQMLLSRMFTKLQEYKECRQAHGIDFTRVGIPEKNPCTSVPKTRPVKRRQTMTLEEFQRMKYHADDDLTDIILMLLWTRLRPGDLRRITSNEVDIKRMRIEGIQNKTITTRNPSGLPYMIPITDKMTDILLPRLTRTKPGTPIFPFKNMQKRWKELRSLAGLKHIQMRDLRRTAATFLLDSGIDTRTVSEGLGHADEKMLPVYTPRTLQHQKKSMEMLTKVFE